jgi:hypothetical protein
MQEKPIIKLYWKKDMQNIANRLQRIINLWASGHHPALQEVYIEDTYNYIWKMDNHIKFLEKENKHLSTLVKLYEED